MTNGLVSVIIPCYNAERYLCETIDSALAQTYEKLEIIAVDDGSTDSTPSLLRSYGVRIRVVTQVNAGSASARNAGIAASSGEFLALLDSDDIWLPDKIQAQIDAAILWPEAGLIHTKYEFMDERGFVAKPEPRGCLVATLQKDVIAQLLGRNPVMTSSCCIRRSVIDAVGGFDESYRSSEDWDLYLRIAPKYVFALVPATLVRYRVHRCSKSFSGWMHARGAFKLQSKVDEQRDSLLATLSPALARRAWRAHLERKSRAHYVLGKLYLRDGDPGEALSHFQSALRLCPYVGRFWARTIKASLSLLGRRRPARHREADSYLEADCAKQPETAREPSDRSRFISIIIPAYNAALFLGRTIASVRAQAASNWECIIVDDGSADETFAVAQSLAAEDKRIRCVRQQNQGVASARNRGFSESDPNASYVIFLDHDDEWMPDCLDVLLDALESNGDSAAAHGLAVACTPGNGTKAREVKNRIRKKAGETGSIVDADPSEPTRRAMLVWDNCITTTGCVLFRRTALGSLPYLFDPAMVPLDDWDLYFRCSAFGPFAFVDRAVIQWWVHGGNQSRERAVMDAATCAVYKGMLESTDGLTDAERSVARARLRRMVRSSLRHQAEDAMPIVPKLIAEHRYIDAAKLWLAACGRYGRYLLMPFLGETDLSSRDRQKAAPITREI